MERPRRRSGVLSLARELAAFMNASKRWWLLPPLVVLLALSALILFAESSALAPFIYTLF
ncbi:MAG: hypothetical protein AMXMBFR13_33800 [Phycisphaerae bacterium]